MSLAVTKQGDLIAALIRVACVAHSADGKAFGLYERIAPGKFMHWRRRPTVRLCAALSDAASTTRSQSATAAQRLMLPQP